MPCGFKPRRHLGDVVEKIDTPGRSLRFHLFREALIEKGLTHSLIGKAMI